MIRRHGGDAGDAAARLADELLELGDMSGKRIWYRILAAIDALQARTPGERPN